ncbi:MAG: enoyl-CoA hydratase-related protein, partial [Acidimicrobiia bacterium]
MSTSHTVAPLEPITFDRDPLRYRHWSVRVDGEVATVTMAVDPDGGLRADYQLRLNSYDLGVDIELHDIVQRLRFEHPEVHAVVLTSGVDKTFCAGANIQMLAGATHAHKVNFCKFTNETRNSIEDAGRHSGQVWLAAVNGTAAGGGYELALACEDIVLIDDRSSAVSLPEVALLAVLPGTGGLTRVVDKRKVRRDLADVFSTRTEGARGRQALQWGLVDAIAPRSSFEQTVAERAAALAARSDRPTGRDGAITLGPLTVTDDGRTRRYGRVAVDYDREQRSATITIAGPTAADAAGGAVGRLAAEGARWWPLDACRQLDDAMLHLRANEAELGTWVLRTEGDAEQALALDAALADAADHWLVREIRLYWARTLRRLDLSARTLITLIEPGSCFAGTLAELAWAADRTQQYDDLEGERAAATLTVDAANVGRYPMANGLTRLQ